MPIRRDLQSQCVRFYLSIFGVANVFDYQIVKTFKLHIFRFYKKLELIHLNKSKNCKERKPNNYYLRYYVEIICY